MPSHDRITAGFHRAGIQRAQLLGALRRMCPSALKGYTAAVTADMRRSWSPLNPTRFCCYFVSEMVFWYCAPVGSIPMAVPVPGDNTLHRYVEWPDGFVVDLTCDQFVSPPPYSLGEYRPFLQTAGHGPSRRAVQLAQLLGLTTVIWKDMRPIR
jgi:hypothetical protein